MNFQYVMKTKRKQLGYTLKDIADMMGVTEATVQRWESGNIKSLRQGRIATLADILNVTPSVLMGWENEDNQKAVESKLVEYFTPHEKSVIEAYRAKPEMQSAVDTLLGIKHETIEERPTRTIKIAAYGGGVIDHKITATDEEIKTALEESEEDQYIIKKGD